MPLDLNKLQNIHPTGDGFQCACPCCRENGSDSTGNHLRIWRSGKWACAIAPGDKEHNSRIWALAGDGSDETAMFEPLLPPVEIDRAWDVSVLDRLIADHSYWIGRGVREDVLPPLRGGVATSGVLKDRYVFPIFDWQDPDRIIGFTGRALKPGMALRYKHIGGVRRWVWGGLDEIEASRHAILVEGCGCRLALDSHDILNNLVLWGVNMSPAVLGALISLNPTRIDIATNNDTNQHKAGQKAALKIKGVLDRFFSPSVTRITLPPVKDFLEIPDEDGWRDWRARLERDDGEPEPEAMLEGEEGRDMEGDEGS